MRISDWSSDVCSSDLAFIMKRIDERRVELEQRLAAGDDDIAAVTRLAPGAGGGGGKRTGRLALASIRPAADEIGVAEGAVSRRAVPFPAGQQITTRQEQEPPRAAGLPAFAMQSPALFLKGYR